MDVDYFLSLVSLIFVISIGFGFLLILILLYIDCPLIKHELAKNKLTK